MHKQSLNNLQRLICHKTPPTKTCHRHVVIGQFLSGVQPAIGLMSRVFTNGLGDQGSIPGRVIPKTQKMVLDSTLDNTKHYKVKIKVKWSNPVKGAAPSPTPRCYSYQIGSLLFTLN